jgi:hypothetical protein
MEHLTKINDKHFKYNETVEGESIKFDVRFNGENWYTDFMDVEGDTPTEVVEQVFELMREESIFLMEQYEGYNY